MERRWIPTVVAALAVLSVLALVPFIVSATSGSSSGATITLIPASSTAPATDAEAQQQHDAFVARTVADLKSQTTPEQLPAFDDNHIEYAEYEAAISKSVECLQAAGITVQPLQQDGWRLTFTFTGDPDPVANRKLLDIYDACYVKYTRDIDAAWAGENSRVLTQAQDAQASTEMIACLQAHGVSLPAPVSRDVWFAVRDTNPPAFGDCANTIQTKFGALP